MKKNPRDGSRRHGEDFAFSWRRKDAKAAKSCGLFLRGALLLMEARQSLADLEAGATPLPGLQLAHVRLRAADRLGYLLLGEPGRLELTDQGFPVHG